MKREDVLQLVKEEIDDMMKRAHKNTPKIEKKLMEVHKKLFKEPIAKESLGQVVPRLEKRIHANLVAEMIDVGIDELLLYFLNDVKARNERSLVEYRLGHCYFYVV